VTDPSAPASPSVDRRTLLGGAAAVVAAGLVAGSAGPASASASAVRTSAASPALKKNPFTLGISSGDPLPTAVIIWTRLAPTPLALDSGMPAKNYTVSWQVATDAAMKKVIKSGSTTATPAHGHSVHVDVKGLHPDSWYFYRFKVGKWVSKIGRTRTAPAAGQIPASFTFGQTNCANWQSGYYQLYGDLASGNLDYWMALGDYIYEYGNKQYMRDSGLIAGRTIPWTKHPFTVQEFRRQYALYKGDPYLQKLHAFAPYSAIWDDHEVDNNYTAGKDGGNPGGGPKGFATRRANAYQAYWENHAIRANPPVKGAMRIYRTIDWGGLARFYYLDGRQYRSDQPGGKAPSDFGPWVEDQFSDTRTMLGAQQEAWLLSQMTASKAQWNFICQQTVMSDLNGAVAVPALYPKGLYNYDSWDGYWKPRARFTTAITDSKVPNPVLLSGDFHTNLAFNLLNEWPDPHNFMSMTDQAAATATWDKPVVATEIAAGAVSSPGFFQSGSLAAIGPATLANTPWAKYGDLKTQGVVRHTVTSDSTTSVFRVCDAGYKASTAAGKPRVGATVTTKSGTPGIDSVVLPPV
jgi:alkaline phosphatase D